jgi:lipopolysaccharide transport system permease protein
VARGPSRRTRIEPPRAWQSLDWPELWEYRELLFFLVWRDVKVRYKQTVLGASWAILQPLMTTLVFTIFFGRLGGLSRHVEGAYSVFVFAALLPWTFFANALTQASSSVVGAGNLISKVYFPRILIPVAAIAVGVIDLAVVFVVLLVMMAVNGVAFTWQLLALPLFVLGTMVTAAGAGALLAALVVAYRDFRHVSGFLVQLWMFASPVVYPLEVIPSEWRLLYSLNPMAGMISGFRSAALGEPFVLDTILISSLMAILILVAGVQYFLQVQRRFADII